MQELPVILIAVRRRLEISFGSRGHFVTSNRAAGRKFERNVLPADSEQKPTEEVEEEKKEEKELTVKESARARV